MTKLYIAGPMTGIPNWNFLAFVEAEDQLKKAGFEVINPVRHGHSSEPWEQYMRLGLRDVLDADGVALLPGWTASRGATLERHVVQRLRMPAHPLQHWLIGARMKKEL